MLPEKLTVILRSPTFNVLLNLVIHGTHSRTVEWENFIYFKEPITDRPFKVSKSDKKSRRDSIYCPSYGSTSTHGRPRDIKNSQYLPVCGTTRLNSVRVKGQTFDVKRKDRYVECIFKSLDDDLE